MKEMDKDNDGFLSMVELTNEEMQEKDKKVAENAFNIADADKDGKLSAAELPVAMKEFESFSEAEGEDGKEDDLSPEAIMKEMDKDNDGFLSLVELTNEEMEEKEFNTADADKDGKLSAAELPVAIKEFERSSE